MKRAIWLGFALALAACTSTPTEPLALTEADHQTTVQVEVGDIITVSLQSNPSTGYAWQPEVPGVLTLVQQDYNQASDLVGASGIETFEFEATAAGDGILRMVYGQSFDSASEDGQFEVTLVVASKD